MATRITKKAYGGWPNCISLDNGLVEVILSTDVGPRILFYGFRNGANHMHLVPEHAGRTGDEDWVMYGGHRLWHSPEERPRTYDEDNFPVAWQKIPNGVTLVSRLDEWVQVEKELEVTLDPDSSRVQVIHRLTNRNAWDIELSVWALTVMAQGGREIIPQVQDGPELLPNRSVALWTYTRMNDPRVTWGERYIFLDQDPGAATPFKIGLPVPDGWAAYANHGQLFVKHFDFDPEAEYPDFGLCSYETYTNPDFIELESLSPLWLIEPGEAIEHVEAWELFQDVPKPLSEDDADRLVLPCVRRERPAVVAQAATKEAKPKRTPGRKPGRATSKPADA